MLTARLDAIFADGKVDPEELEDLRELLAKITGEKAGEAEGERKSTQLPIDDPQPDIDFAEKFFCFTGKFTYGTRRACDAAVEQRGGNCHGAPTQETDYLVIGWLGSRDWIYNQPRPENIGRVGKQKHGNRANRDH